MWTMAAVAGSVALLAAMPAIGAVKPPAVEPPGKGSGILAYIVAGLLAIVAVSLCAMPSRRGHQD